MIETNWRGNDIQKLQYGQVQSFWVCHAPASIWTPTPQIFILALLAPCTLTEGRDAQDEVVTFKNLNATYFVDVQTIEAVVGGFVQQSKRMSGALLTEAGHMLAQYFMM